MSKLLWGPGYSMLISLWQLLVPYACTKSAINTCAFSSSSLGQAGFFSWIESALVYKFLSYIVPFSGTETEGRCSSAWYDFILSKYLIVARKIKVGCCTTQAVWYHSIIFFFFFLDVQLELLQSRRTGRHFFPLFIMISLMKYQSIYKGCSILHLQHGWVCSSILFHE